MLCSIAALAFLGCALNEWAYYLRHHSAVSAVVAVASTAGLLVAAALVGLANEMHQRDYDRRATGLSPRPRARSED